MRTISSVLPAVPLASTARDTRRVTLRTASAADVPALLPGASLYESAGDAAITAHDAILPDGERIAVVAMRKSLSTRTAAVGQR